MYLPGWGEIVRLFVPVVIAASQSLTITNVPVRIDERQEFDIDVEFLCPSCTTDSYLRAVLYVSGTSYFGYTQSNDGVWSNAPGSQCTQYFLVPKDDLSAEGTWSGHMRVKPDPESGNYDGPGEYNLKVGRYTPSCSSASVWSEPVPIALSGPTNTPVPTQTPKPQPSSTPSFVPTYTPLPVTDTPVPAVSVALLSTPAILGESDSKIEATMRAKPIFDGVATVSGISHRRAVFPLLIAGVGLAITSCMLAVRDTRVWKKTQKAQ